MVDGYTPEGYAYALVGTRKQIKCIFRSNQLEVYMYDFAQPCQLCDNQPYEPHDRIYVLIRGKHLREGWDPTDKADVWVQTQIFCPECWELLANMFKRTSLARDLSKIPVEDDT